MSLPEGTVTFLRSDIEGSMELVRALGHRFDEANAEHHAIVRTAVAANHGELVRTEGDAVFAVFSAAGEAARAAIEIQHAMATHVWPGQHPLKLRIGIHVGSATRTGDDYGGFEVNRAARIAGAGWGGQTIISDPVRALLEGEFGSDWHIRDLGRHRLKGVPAPERLFQLEAPGLPTSFPPLRSGYGPSEHLPGRVSSFVGRTADLRALEELFDHTRLLTLTGPGGTGKTSLALELSRRRAEGFADGAWYVDLQAVRDPDMVRSEVATALSLLDGPAGPAADRLLAYVAEQELLLLIDNFEQVLDAAPLVAELIAASPRSKVVVTSRMALRLSSEQEFSVQPLGWRPQDDGEEGEAVRLFVERARRARPDLALDATTLDVVREICRLVDGLPLAVELCASRAAALPVTVIRDRLAGRLSLPGSGPRDLPDRQRTIESTVAWSHDLLDEPLKVLFACLGVFRESFDYDQAETICGPSDRLGVDVLDGLVQLAERSLLSRVDDRVGGVRFGMLETIRSFAAARLDESGRRDELQMRHADAYIALASEAAPQLEEWDPRPARDRLEADDANLRAAIDWALERGEVRRVHAVVGSLWRYWQLTGRLSEAGDRITAALAMPGADEPTHERLQVLAARASTAYWRGDMATALRGYEHQRDEASQLDDIAQVADAWYSLIFAYGFPGDLEASVQAQANARGAFEQLGDSEGLEKVELAALTTLLPALYSDPDRYVPELEARLARIEAFENDRARAEATVVRAGMALIRRDLPAAIEFGAKAMRQGCEVGREGDVVMMLPLFILTAAEQKRFEVAALALGAFDEVRTRYGALPASPFDEYGASDPSDAIRASMGDERFLAAYDRGARMPLPEVVDAIETSVKQLTG